MMTVKARLILAFYRARNKLKLHTVVLRVKIVALKVHERIILALSWQR
jgi:hypothetical protein